MEKENISYPQEINFSFQTLLKNRKDDLNYLWAHKWRTLLFGLCGGFIGLMLSFWWPVSYTARLSFVVEDSRNNGGSLVSDLAGKFGFDIGSLSGVSGIMAGENVQELLKSNTILKRTLLTPYDESGKNTLADAYAKTYGLKNSWESKYLDKGNLNFPANPKVYNRLQDSLLQDMVNRIVKNQLTISKPDKKQGFFEVTTTLADERLAALLCSGVLQEGAEFYIQTKTKKLKNNVDRLQLRADSITRLLNRRTYSASSSSSLLLDINPAYATAKVSSEVDEREKFILSSIYSEIIKNLEISKTLLIQETPTVQVLDQPDFPLKKNSLKWYEGIAYGGLFGGLCAILLLLFTQPAKTDN